MIEQIIGEIRLFCGNYAPQDWAFCNGQLLPVAQYGALFSIIGTAYGGDGRTNFALPDFRGRIPVGVADPGKRGQKGGNETTSLQIANLPAHTHTTTVSLKASGSAGTQTSPVNGYPANTGGRDPEYNNTANTVMGTKPNVMVVPAGQNQPMNNMQPYLTLNFIIALEGIFPPRS